MNGYLRLRMMRLAKKVRGTVEASESFKGKLRLRVFEFVIENDRNQAIVQGDRVNIQSKNSGNDGRNIRHSYVQEEIIEGNNVQNDAGNIQRTLRTMSSGTATNVQCYNCSEKGHYARNCPKPRVRDSKYFMEQMLLAKQDEAGVILTNEQNDFLFANASRMEEIKELSENICLMARIQPANFDSDEGLSYDSAFLSKYPKQPKIINNTIGDDQIDSNIIFDEPNRDVNSGSVEYDNNVQELYALEQLARNAYKEAEKQQIIAKKIQQQNTVLTKQLESYKEKVWVFEMNKGNNTTYFDEYIKVDRKAKRFEQESESQFIHDRDVIRDLEQQRDKLELSVVELKRQTMELQKSQSILKCKMSENEDKYHDTVLDLKARAKKNEDVNPKLYDASCLDDSKIQINVRDTEDILDDATTSQIKMKKKSQDSIAIEKKNVWTINYKKLNALYEDFVPQEEFSAEQKYFSSSENSSNASSPYSSSETKPTVTPMPSANPMLVDLNKMENIFKTLFELLQMNSKRESIFYTSLEEIRLTNFYIKETKDAFDSTENDLSETWKQNELLKEQLLEAKLKHEIECCVLLRLRAISSVRRSSNRDSLFKNSVLSNTKNSSEKVEISDRSNKKSDVASKNVDSNKKIVTNDDIKNALITKNVVQIVLWIVNSGCSNHMTGDRSLLKIFIEKFTRTVRFGNDHFATITSYGDYIQGDITVCHVYYVEGLGHNLFSVGQFCDGDLEVAFHSKSCYVRNLEGDDLLTGDRESNFYTISISDMAAFSPVCLMSKATSTKSWGKRKKASPPPKVVPSNHSKLELLHIDLCGPMLVASINRKRYILVIVDDYSRFTWVYFLRTKDETPEIIQNFIARVQLNYNAKVCKIRTDNGTEFNNATLKAHYDKLGIMQQFSIARTPQQNGVVERRNRTLVKAAPTMLIFSRLPEFLWAEAVSTACFTQNWSIIHTRYNKTPYELLHVRKPNVEYFHVFGSLCYPKNDRDNLGKMKPKADIAESINIPSKEDLDNLFRPMYEEYFEKRSSDTSINSAAQQVHNHEDSPSTSSIVVEEHEAPPIVTTSEEQTSPIPLNEADESNQEDSADFDGNTAFISYDVPNFEEAESSTTALDPSNMHDTLEPKNIKEAMPDHSWIESMQDELHQFERLDVWELVPRPDVKNIITVKWLHEASFPIVTTSEEQTSSIPLNEADESNQEDSADFDGNTAFVSYDVLNFEEAESSTTDLDP
ncbi:retrovirus-related pol polyprotein from transposon TNT 1-94 [Tanacetum coccineum]